MPDGCRREGLQEFGPRRSTGELSPHQRALAMRILTVHVRISLAKGKAAVARQRGSASVRDHAWPGAAAVRAGASFADLSGLVSVSTSSAARRQRMPAVKKAGR